MLFNYWLIKCKERFAPFFPGSKITKNVHFLFTFIVRGVLLVWQYVSLYKVEMDFPFSVVMLVDLL